MINNFPAFEPVLLPKYPGVAGLRMFIGPRDGTVAGYVVISNVLYVVPTQFVNLSPLSITYVYLDLTTALIRSNNAGFSGSVYPIAVLSTNATEVTGMTDYRPDILALPGGGGGGSGTDAVQAFAAPGTITMGAGQNLFGTVIAAATPLALPSATGLGGQSVKLIKIDGGATNSITGAVGGTYFLSNTGQFVIFETDGSSWYVVGAN